jgi:hypothetical protein
LPGLAAIVLASLEIASPVMTGLLCRGDIEGEDWFLEWLLLSFPCPLPAPAHPPPPPPPFAAPPRLFRASNENAPPRWRPLPPPRGPPLPSKEPLGMSPYEGISAGAEVADGSVAHIEAFNPSLSPMSPKRGSLAVLGAWMESAIEGLSSSLLALSVGFSLGEPLIFGDPFVLGDPLTLGEPFTDTRRFLGVRWPFGVDAGPSAACPGPVFKGEPSCSFTGIGGTTKAV